MIQDRLVNGVFEVPGNVVCSAASASVGFSTVPQSVSGHRRRHAGMVGG